MQKPIDSRADQKKKESTSFLPRFFSLLPRPRQKQRREEKKVWRRRVKGNRPGADEQESLGRKKGKTRKTDRHTVIEGMNTLVYLSIFVYLSVSRDRIGLWRRKERKEFTNKVSRFSSSSSLSERKTDIATFFVFVVTEGSLVCTYTGKREDEAQRTTSTANNKKNKKEEKRKKRETKATFLQSLSSSFAFVCSQGSSQLSLSLRFFFFPLFFERSPRRMFRQRRDDSGLLHERNLEKQERAFLSSAKLRKSAPSFHQVEKKRRSRKKRNAVSGCMYSQEQQIHSTRVSSRHRSPYLLLISFFSPCFLTFFFPFWFFTSVRPLHFPSSNQFEKSQNDRDILEKAKKERKQKKQRAKEIRR